MIAPAAILLPHPFRQPWEQHAAVLTSLPEKCFDIFPKHSFTKMRMQANINDCLNLINVCTHYQALVKKAHFWNATRSNIPNNRKRNCKTSQQTFFKHICVKYEKELNVFNTLITNNCDVCKYGKENKLTIWVKAQGKTCYCRFNQARCLQECTKILVSWS